MLKNIVITMVYVITFLFANTVMCLLADEVFEKNIVVVMTAYNNSQWCERSLQSVFSQQYCNYSVIYIDDCSTDNAPKLIHALLDKYDTHARVTYIQNPVRLGALANHWRAVHMIGNDAIVVHLDGDDWFAHDHVLARVNQEYQDESVWMTYGQFIVYPSGDLGHSRLPDPLVLANNCWRSAPFLRYSHLRTFYAWLFKCIQLDDLMFNNQFFPVACDNAFMLPMLEMAGSHVRFIEDVLYVYNQDNPLNDFKQRLQLQLAVADYIKRKDPYRPLNQPLSPTIKKDNNVNLIIFSFDRPMQLYACLESIKRYMKSIGSIKVLYRASTEEFEHGYEILQTSFCDVVFIQQSHEDAHKNFKQQLIECAFDGAHDYCMFAVDDMVVKDYVDLAVCIEYLEKTHAYGFFLRLGKNITKPYLLDLSTTRESKIPPYLELDETICAWQFKCAQHDWAYPNTVDMTLYRTKDIEPIFRALTYTTPNSLEGIWYGSTTFKNIGLCFKESKALNIPLNVVQEVTHNNMFNNKHALHMTTQKLYQLLREGFKIDITPLYRYRNSSAHIDYSPTFIVRNDSISGLPGFF